MTKGTTAETVDGMSLAKIDRIIDALRYEWFRWTPVRRVNIPKPNGKTRPLGIPTWTDKLLQEVIRMILEAYYEPQFSDHSHGFRPDRGCHTALSEAARRLTLHLPGGLAMGGAMYVAPWPGCEPFHSRPDGQPATDPTSPQTRATPVRESSLLRIVSPSRASQFPKTAIGALYGD